MDTPPTLPGRYTALSLLGRGGAGEVWRVRDAALGRDVAMKVLRPDRAEDPRSGVSFEAEARTIARLQHPGIIPIHDFGVLPDRRCYYTMREVRGRTLREVLREDPGELRRTVEHLTRACEAVAFAHANGVLHRDLNPRNIMVGDYGEVLVLDWGLAVAGASVGSLEPGSVTGTPAYMSPEQAGGANDRLTPAADVWSLGAVLYEVLTGRAAYSGASTWAILMQVLQRPPQPLPALLGERARDPAVAALIRVIERAMEREPARRFPDAGQMARALGDWLLGADRRDQALGLVAEADALRPAARRLREEAVRLREEASAKLRGVRPFDPIELKRPAWILERQAERLESEARASEQEAVLALEAALRAVPEMPEAHERLAAWHQARHADAEARRDLVRAAEEERALRAHNRGEWTAYLSGDGSLTLHTQPPGAEVSLLRFEEEDRRLVPRPLRELGTTPLVELSLPMGSYLLELRKEGYATVRYPVSIGRQERWDGVAPGETEPRAIALPREGLLGEDDLYVPGGWFRMGGDADCPTALPGSRQWVDPFIIRRFSLTNAEYLAYLNALVAAGREDEAIAHCPRALTTSHGGTPTLMLAHTPGVGFELAPDPQGDPWLPEHAVVNVSWYDAEAYCRWRAEREGLPWRLPREAEWEKAARGVDGRFFPWGDSFDATFCCMRDSHPGLPTMPKVTQFPADLSVYGLRGAAGIVRDWCADTWRPQSFAAMGGPNANPSGPTPRVYRGGSWLDHAIATRCAGRAWTHPIDLFSRIGFRLVRDWSTD